MATTIALQPTEMGGWPPGTRHWRTADGQDYAVIAGADLSAAAREAIDTFLEARGEAQLEELPAGTAIPVEQTPNEPGHSVVPQPTAIIACLPNGQAVDLTALWSFPAGTTAADALTQAGFEVQQ